MKSINIAEIIEVILFLTNDINIYYEFYIKNHISNFNNKRFISLFKNIDFKDIINMFKNYKKNEEILLWLKDNNKLEILNMTSYEKMYILNYCCMDSIKFLYNSQLLSETEINFLKILYSDLF